MTIPTHAQRVASRACRICQHDEHVVVEGRMQHLFIRSAHVESSDPWTTLVTCRSCGVTDFFVEPDRLEKIDGATIISVPRAPT